MREKMPARRLHWTQRVKIEGQTFYLCCGEREDGRLGEIFVDAHKHGTFTRGILDALARMVSLAVQCGATPEEIVETLSELNFPPNGPVFGTNVTGNVASIADWIAKEIAAVYVADNQEPDIKTG